MTYIAPVLGLLAGLVGIADTIPYVRDTVRGSTRPHRGTWLIWSVLAMVVCLSQRADGASWSLIMAAAQAVLTSAVFLLSIRRGEGGLSPADVLMITLAGGGVIGWIVSDEPVIATACVVAADLIGAAMMVPKTYRDPGSETLATFALASLSGALAAGAVGAPDPSLLLYPAYFCLVNGAIAVLIHHRRSLLASLQAPASTSRTTRWRPGGHPEVMVRSFAWRLSEATRKSSVVTLVIVTGTRGVSEFSSLSSTVTTFPGVSLIGMPSRRPDSFGRVENYAAAELQGRVIGHGGLAVLGDRGPDVPGQRERGHGELHHGHGAAGRGYLGRALIRHAVQGGGARDDDRRRGGCFDTGWAGGGPGPGLAARRSARRGVPGCEELPGLDPGVAPVPAAGPAGWRRARGLARRRRGQAQDPTGCSSAAAEGSCRAPWSGRPEWYSPAAAAGRRPPSSGRHAGAGPAAGGRAGPPTESSRSPSSRR